MSLLIKALDKAEKAQVEKAAEQQKAEQKKLAQGTRAAPDEADGREASRRRADNIANTPAESIADVPFVLELTAPEQAQVQATQALAHTAYAETHSSARASNVFASKAVATTEIKPIVWIMLLGVLGLLSIAGYFYYQLNQMQAPVVSPATQPQHVAVSTPLAVNTQQPPTPAIESSASTSASTTQEMKPDLPAEPTVAPVTHNDAPPPVKAISQQPLASQSIDLPSVKIVRSDTKLKHTPESQSLPVPTIASQSASIKVSRNTAAPAVNPVLMNAYQAYLAGNDSEAQQLYKRVLQRETHNVDALLGMAAIAERQNRTQDALGWYQKVLEADPKNAIALNATVGNIPDQETQVSQLKTLIAQHPNNAHAHANLGAYFAEQSQWPEAQQSYFEAYRLNASAENAFNLAVSLDQMGKSSLALPYYQQALALAASTQSSAIDVAALQARMAAIQAQ